MNKNLGLVFGGILIGCGVGLLGLIAVILAVTLWFSSSKGDSANLTEQQSHAAPDFVLKMLDGPDVRLSDLRGKAVLVNFWATWCGPCRQEMPLLESYYEKYSPNLVILAVNDGEDPFDVRGYAAEMGLKFNILLDPDTAVSDLYRVSAFPTSLFIDPDGQIIYRHVGLLNEDQLVGYLKGVGVIP